MKKLILAAALIGGIACAQPASAQPMQHHGHECHYMKHGHRIGTDHHGCPIYRHHR